MTANIENKAYNKKSPAAPKAGRIIGITLCYIFLILICFTCVFPFLWMFLSSLKTVEEAVNTLTLTFFAKAPQWHNYAVVFEKIDMFRGFLNTMAIEVATIPFCVFMSGLSAFAFSKMDLKHKNVHLMVQLSALMIPYACVVLPLYRAYYSLNLTDTLCAGYLRQYVSFMLPMMGPAVAAQVIFMFVGNWNDFFAPSLYLTVEKVMTLQLMLKSLSDSKVDLPVSFAGAVIASVPLYVIYIIFQRYFIEGMAISAVKG